MRTQEQLEEYFNAFKLKKQREKQLQRQKHQKQLQELYKKVDKTLKQEKKQKAEEIINSFKQTSAEPPKQTTIIPTTTIGDFHEENLYTKEELMNIETLYPNETGRINWLKFDEIVKQTKNEIHNLFKN